MLGDDPAFEVASVERSAAAAVHSHVLCDAFLQARRRHDDLEDGAGRELCLNGFVEQRVVVVIDQLGPFGMLDAYGEVVGVERGPADHGQDFAGPRIHSYDCPVVPG